MFHVLRRLALPIGLIAAESAADMLERLYV
jgi:hypothetical protein